MDSGRHHVPYGRCHILSLSNSGRGAPRCACLGPEKPTISMHSQANEAATPPHLRAPLSFPGLLDPTGGGGGGTVSAGCFLGTSPGAVPPFGLGTVVAEDLLGSRHHRQLLRQSPPARKRLRDGEGAGARALGGATEHDVATSTATDDRMHDNEENKLKYKQKQATWRRHGAAGHPAALRGWTTCEPFQNDSNSADAALSVRSIPLPNTDGTFPADAHIHNEAAQTRNFDALREATGMSYSDAVPVASDTEPDPEVIPSHNVRSHQTQRHKSSLAAKILPPERVVLPPPHNSVPFPLERGYSSSIKAGSKPASKLAFGTVIEHSTERDHRISPTSYGDRGHGRNKLATKPMSRRMQGIMAAYADTTQTPTAAIEAGCAGKRAVGGGDNASGEYVGPLGGSRRRQGGYTVASVAVDECGPCDNVRATHSSHDGLFRIPPRTGRCRLPTFMEHSREDILFSHKTRIIRPSPGFGEAGL